MPGPVKGPKMEAEFHSSRHAQEGFHRRAGRHRPERGLMRRVVHRNEIVGEDILRHLVDRLEPKSLAGRVIYVLIVEYSAS